MLKMQTVLVAGVLLSAIPAQAIPSWCGDARFRGSGETRKALAETEVRPAIDQLIAVACAPDADAAAAEKELAEARARWGAMLGLAEDEWADAVAWTQAQPSSKYDTGISWDPYPLDRPWSSFGAIDQFSMLSDSRNETIFFADSFPTLTEAGKFGFIVNCIRRENAPLFWAVCQNDIDTLDRKKVLDELRADTKAGPFEKMILRFVLIENEGRLKKHAAKVAEYKARDDAYAKMFKIAETSRAAWQKASPEFIELAHKMWDVRMTGSTRLAAGCYEKTLAAVNSAVAALPATDTDVIIAEDAEVAVPVALGATPDGYLAMFAHFNCVMTTETSDPWAQLFSYQLYNTPGFRGPHTATQTAIIAANLVLDKKGDTFSNHIEQHEKLKGALAVNVKDGRGAVQDIKIKGDKATIVFASDFHQEEQCMNLVVTNRVSRIDGNGNVMYASRCTKFAMVKVDYAATPVEVDKKRLAGLAKGMETFIRDGGVMFAKKKKAKKPSILFGTAIK